MIWFMIGFGAGLFIISFRKYIIIAAVAAVVLPIVLAALGFTLPITPETVTNALLKGLDMLADLLAGNRYAVYGFMVGIPLGLLTTSSACRGASGAGEAI